MVLQKTPLYCVQQHAIRRDLMRQVLLQEEQGIGDAHQAPQPLRSAPE